MSTEILFEIGTRLGREHAQDHERFRLHWEEHVQRSREMILRGAERVTTPDAVTILGAGAAYNIPLEELAGKFNHIRMVDIDREGLQQAVESMPPELRSKAEVHVADTTGGVAARLLDQGLEIIRTSADEEDTKARLIALFNGQGLDMTPEPSRVQAWKASYIVSSGLSSQLNIFPEKACWRRSRKSSATNSPRSFSSKEACPIYATNGFAGTASSWPRLYRRTVEFIGRTLWPRLHI